jgi:hypothetical protein
MQPLRDGEQAQRRQDPHRRGQQPRQRETGMSEKPGPGQHEDQPFRAFDQAAVAARPLASARALM